MKKNKNRFLAGLLAVALVMSNFASDYSAIKVYAADETSSESASTEEVTAEPAQENTAEAAPAEAAPAEAQPEEVATPAAETTPETEVTAPAAEATQETEVTTPAAEGTQGTEVTAPAAEGTQETEATTPAPTDTEVPAPAAGEETQQPEAQMVTITYAVEDAAQGYVTKTSEQVNINAEDAMAAVEGSTAVANSGYKFKDWTVTVGEETKEVSISAEFKPVDKPAADITYTAHFLTDESPKAEDTAKPAEETKKTIYKITYSAAEGGSVSKTEETFDPSDSAAVLSGATAEANEGYDFKDWTDAAGSEVSTDSTYVPSTAGISADASFTANFTKKPEETKKEVKNVTVTYSAGKGGSVGNSSETIDLNDDSSSLKGTTAVADDGYTFKNWTDADGSVVSEKASFTPSKENVKNDVTYTANFTKNETAPDTSNKITITYKASEGGSVDIKSETTDLNDSKAEIKGATAAADDGYTFKSWTDADGKVVSEEAAFAPAKDGLKADVTYTANFEKTKKEVTVTYKVSNGGWLNRYSETINLADEEAVLQGATATASNKYFTFKNWTDANGNEVSQDAAFVPAGVTKDTTYTANFSSLTEMPPQYFSGEANGLHVKAYADADTFPANTTMKVTAVSSDVAIAAAEKVMNDKVVDATAVDITFYDADGNEVEPANSNNVYVILRADSDVEGQDHSVVHISDGSAEVIGDAGAKNASFEAARFSIYAIIGTGETGTDARRTYYFYNDNKLIEKDTQIVKEGEVLVEPEVPTSTSGNKFLGWSTDQAITSTSTYQEFGKSITGIKEGEEVKLYAHFENECYVTFVDSSDKIVKVIATTAGQEVTTKSVTFAVAAGKALTGWTTEKGNDSKKVTDPYTVSQSVTMYPLVKDAYWITFDGNGDGASYTAPEYVLSGANSVAPADPTRQGYTFAGWYDSATGGNEYAFGTTLSDNLKLYAHWTEGTAKYSVIFWEQKVTDAKDAKDASKTYDYWKSDDSRDATINTAVSPTSADKDPQVGFQYNATNSSTSETVKADGSTVLNIYFDRQLMTLNFYKSSRNNWSIYKTFTGLYGSTLASNKYTWPDDNRWMYGNTTLTFLDAFLFPTSGTTLNLYGYDKSTAATISHYKQNLNGDYPEEATNTTKTASGTFYFSNKYNGFTLSQYSTDGGNTWKVATVGGSTGYSTTLKVRYTRNSYKLDYSSNNSVVKSETYLYEASLAEAAKYVPDRPSGMASYYTFDGWYADEDCTTKFDFSGTMPANNLKVYAKWVAPTYTVTFDYADSTTSHTDTKKVNAGVAVTQPTDPTRTGYTFGGWTLNDASGVTDNPYNFSSQVTSDITLTAKWISNTTLTVVYDLNGGTGTITDNNKYIDNSDVIVLGAPTKAPDGKYFLGWTVGGKTYVPGSTFKITSAMATEGVVKLVATYGDNAQAVSLTYDANGGNGGTTVSNINNA